MGDQERDSSGAEEQQRAKEITDAAKQIQLEAQQAAADAVKKKNLATRLLDGLKNKLNDAQQVRQEKETSGQIKDKKKEALATAVTLAQVFEGIKQQIIKPPEHAPAALNTLLDKMAQKPIHEETSAYLLPILNKMLTDPTYVKFSQEGGTKTQFEYDLDTHVKKSERAMRFMRESFKDAVDNGARFDIPGTEVETKLNDEQKKAAGAPPNEPPKEPPKPPGNQPPEGDDGDEEDSENGEEFDEAQARYDIHNRLFGGGRRGKEVRMEPQEQKRLDELWQKLKFGTSPEEQELRSDIIDYLTMGAEIAARKYQKKPTPDDPNPEQHDKRADPRYWSGYVLEQLRNRLGDTEFREFFDLQQKEQNVGLDLRFVLSDVENGDEIAAKIEALSPHLVLEKLFTLDAEGNRIWNNAGAEDLVKDIKYIQGLLYAKLDRAQGADMGEVFSEYFEGRVQRVIANKISQLSRDRTILDELERSDRNRGRIGALDSLRRQYSDFFQKRITYETYIENQMRRILYQYPDLIKNEPPDRWASGVRRFDVSEVGVMISNDMVNMVMSELKLYVQERITRNGNVVPPNLFAAEKKEGPNPYDRIYTFPDLDRLRDLIRAKLNQMGGEWAAKQDWEIDRAISIARGITLIDGQLTGVMANTRPPSGGDFRDLPFAPILALRNPLLNWVFGRGARDIAKENWTLVIKVRRKELTGNLLTNVQYLWENRWIPTKVLDEAKKWVKDLEDIPEDQVGTFAAKMYEIAEEIATNAEGTFAQLVRKITLGGLLERGGWRHGGLHAEFKREMGKSWKSASWEEKYDWMRKAGVIYQFTYSGERAEEEAEEYLKDKKMDPKLYRDRGVSAGKERFRKVMDVTFGGRPVHHGLTMNEYIEKRTADLHGQSFYHLLLKDPLAFLNNLQQLIPEVADGYIKVSSKDKDGKKTTIEMKAADFYLGDLVDDKGLQDKQKRFKRYLAQRLRTNEDQVKVILDFYSRLIDDVQAPQKDKNGNLVKDQNGNVKRVKDKDYARDRLYVLLSAAHEKARQDGRVEITPQDIWSDQAYNDNPNSEESKIRSLVFGTGTKPHENGLISYFRHYVGDEKKHFGNGKENLGKKDGFFSNMGDTWFNKQVFSIQPNGDADQYKFYRALGDESGENAISRAVGEHAIIKGVHEKVLSLYSAIKKVAAGGPQPIDKAMAPVMEVHSAIKELQDISSAEFMREMQYMVATVVVRALQRHWYDRIPFPIGQILAVAKGRDLAISTRRAYGAGSTSFTLKTDGIRWYANELRRNNYLNENDGLWSYGMLLKSTGASGFKWGLTELVPNTVTAVMLFITWQFISKALKEAEGGGKK